MEGQPLPLPGEVRASGAHLLASDLRRVAAGGDHGDPGVTQGRHPQPLPCSQGVSISRALELAADGWVPRTVSDPNKIAELEETYAGLGFETRTTGLDGSTAGEACTQCAVTACATYVALFTRPKTSP